jgi:Second Messenger Oligonucleotide or Dinucleotide Synthetase domain
VIYLRKGKKMHKQPYEPNGPALGPTSPVGEILLASVAIRIELPPSLHQLAVERFEAVRKYIERVSSPLYDKVAWFYPQGSMAIKATIKSRNNEDGYDIDIVCELNLPTWMTPAQILDLLYQAIKGEKGSKYHDMTERQTRCVTVYYADGMHLDVTPSILLDENDPRRSHIFHAKPEEPVTAHKQVVTNSWAFCERFNQILPPDLIFEQAYAKRAQDADWKNIRADAEVKPVPAHSTIEGGKSAAVVALQLLKRNRNMKYAKRKVGRIPPSVVMAKFTADCQLPTGTIAGALNIISGAMLSAMEVAEAQNVLIEVRNPTCPEDCFTDRWPENRAAQQIYITDLKLFRKQLAELMTGNLDLEEMQVLLIEMFGEGPARSAIEEQARTLGRAVETGSRGIGFSGRVIPGAAVVAPSIISSAMAKPRPHTFFGERWKK